MVGKNLIIRNTILHNYKDWNLQKWHAYLFPMVWDRAVHVSRLAIYRHNSNFQIFFIDYFSFLCHSCQKIQLNSAYAAQFIRIGLHGQAEK